MGLRLSAAASERVADADPVLRAAAQTLGSGLAGRLVALAPPVSSGEATLLELTLDREPEPDPLSLAACVAAHHGYVTRRGQPDAISPGALALARLLVWAARAAMIGPAPQIAWLGPPARCPDPGAADHRLLAECRVEIDAGVRRAQAVALVRPAPTSAA